MYLVPGVSEYVYYNSVTQGTLPQPWTRPLDHYDINMLHRKYLVIMNVKYAIQISDGYIRKILNKIMDKLLYMMYKTNKTKQIINKSWAYGSILLESQ